MTLASFIHHLPDDLKITLADVGSAGGIHKRWQPFRPIIAAMLFEPREGDDIERRGQDTIYPIALGPEAGTATLNVTALPNMSSVLSPNSRLMERFRKKGAHSKVVSTFDMPVDTLDAVARRDDRAIDALKVDTQGSEIGILRGASDCLRQSVLIAEVEVSFFQRYRDQAIAGEIIAFMADHGFELIELSRLKRYRHLNSAGVGNIGLGGGQRAGRLAYGDALFLLEEERLFSRIGGLSRPEGEAAALKAITGLLAYGKADMAARLLDVAGDAIDPVRRQTLTRWFGSLGRRWLRSGFAHHVTDYLSRHV